MGTILNKYDVAKTNTGTPEHLNMYAYDVCGAGSVVRGIEELREGKNVSFAICDRLPEGSGNWPTVREIITFCPVPKRACIRFAGEDGQPMSGGSSTVHGLGSVDFKGDVKDLNPVVMAAHLTEVLAHKTSWYFLLK